MPTKNNMRKLLKESEAASHTDTQQVAVLCLLIHASGTDYLFTDIIEGAEQLSKIKDCIMIISKVTEMPVGYACEPAYASPPCSSFSADWKRQGNEIIRGGLSAMLATAGNGRGKGDQKGLVQPWLASQH